MNINDIIKSNKYKFLNNNEHIGQNIIFITFSGSYSYGTNIETSDIDIKGCVLPSKEDLLGLSMFEHYSDDNTDTTIFGFNKLISLLIKCNPSAIEMLGCKPEHYALISSDGKELLSQRKIFLSRVAKKSFIDYASSQLHRLIINKFSQSEKEKHILDILNKKIDNLNSTNHMSNDDFVNVYTGKSNKSVFDTEIYINMSLNQYPLRDCTHLIQDMYSIMTSCEKLNSRNNKKDKSRMDKHIMHLVRLYLMGIDIFEKEDIITYRQDDLELLLDIRHGKYTNDDGTFNSGFLDIVNMLDKKFEYAYNNTSLPDKPNIKIIEDFVISVNERSLKINETYSV